MRAIRHSILECFDNTVLVNRSSNLYHTKQKLMFLLAIETSRPI